MNLGWRYAFVGHPDRRNRIPATESEIPAAVYNCQHHGVVPILCVGEKKKPANQQELFNVLHEELEKSLEGIMVTDPSHLILAYEAFWRVGGTASKDVSQEELTEIIRYLRAILVERYGDVGTGNPPFIWGIN